MKMTEKTKVSVILSENIENVIILMNASFSEKIKEDKHFFEDLGRKLDASFKGDDSE